MKKIIVSLLLVVMSVQLAYGQNLVENPDDAHFAYRASFSPPENVFQYGFYSRGVNEDLLRHLAGSTCDLDSVLSRSEFISLSYNMNTVIDRFIRMNSRHLASNGGSFYVYEVYVPFTAIDVVRSLENILADPQFNDDPTFIARVTELLEAVRGIEKK